MKEEQERRQRTQQEQTHAQEQPGAQTPGTQPALPSSVGSPSISAPAQSRETALQSGERIGIDTPSLKGSIALKGGRIDDLVLVKYRETVDPGSPEVVLL